jgi:hypothetical protein
MVVFQIYMGNLKGLPLRFVFFVFHRRREYWVDGGQYNRGLTGNLKGLPLRLRRPTFWRDQRCAQAIDPP